VTGEGAAFATRLSACRRSAGLTQQELADRSELSIRAISNLELGRTRTPHPGTVRRLADALGLNGDSRAGFLAAAGRRLGGGAVDPVLGDRPTWADGEPAQTDDSPDTDNHSQALAVTPRQLPAVVPHFIGQATELAALNAVLDAARAVRPVAAAIAVIDGPPGVGKTALAVCWAHQAAAKFPDGQLYVDLRGFGSSDEIMSAGTVIRGFLDALGIPVARIPPDPQAQAGLYRSVLAEKRLLIVVDNARDAEQVRPLLPGSPGCAVVVTSRNRLIGLAAAEGARLITLDVLPAAKASELLARRIGAGRAGAEPDALGELARLCGRLPLALSVAAAVAAARPAVPLAAVAAELAGTASGLGALQTGDPVTDVRTVFSWSCRQLSQEPTRLFRLLGVHSGPDITVPAAATLLGTGPDGARAALDALAMANLAAEHVPGRYRLHDLLRAYAAEQAAEHEPEAERRAAIQRVLDYYLHTAHAAALLLAPSREPIVLTPARPGVMRENLVSDQQAMAWFEAEHQVLLAATSLAAASDCDGWVWQLPWAMADFLDRRGHWQEWAAIERSALAAATRLGDPAGQALSRRLLAHACIQLGDYDQARAHLTDCLSFYQRLGDRFGQARTHQSLAVVASRQGRHADALAHDEETLDLVRAAGDQARLAAALTNVGYNHAQLGDYKRARVFCREALDLHRQLDYRPAEAHAWASLGYAEHRLGNHTQAADCCARALGIFRDLGDSYEQAGVLTLLGEVRHTAEDPQQARNSWQQALDILEDLHHPDAAKVRAKLRQQP
jgi:tetratricopeptide (TPR) repeat protein/transcriptional regulator with XRE-family HTH domain